MLPAQHPDYSAAALSRLVSEHLSVAYNRRGQNSCLEEITGKLKDSILCLYDAYRHQVSATWGGALSIPRRDHSSIPSLRYPLCIRMAKCISTGSCVYNVALEEFKRNRTIRTDIQDTSYRVLLCIPSIQSNSFCHYNSSNKEELSKREASNNIRNATYMAKGVEQQLGIRDLIEISGARREAWNVARSRFPHETRTLTSEERVERLRQSG